MVGLLTYAALWCVLWHAARSYVLHAACSECMIVASPESARDLTSGVLCFRRRVGAKRRNSAESAAASP
eukprot:10805539-Alexandrium_andersonii.AAC.1